jgi:nascent polypeptide-associated complex subunit alpha
MFGGAGLDPRKMQKMMKQMGIEMNELDATSVVIETPEETLHFDDVQVTRMDAKGQQTYQIIGEPRIEEGTVAVEAVPAEDISLVASRAGVDEDVAAAALEDAEGDLAAAIAALE